MPVTKTCKRCGKTKQSRYFKKSTNYCAAVCWPAYHTEKQRESYRRGKYRHGIKNSRARSREAYRKSKKADPERERQWRREYKARKKKRAPARWREERRIYMREYRRRKPWTVKESNDRQRAKRESDI